MAVHFIHIPKTGGTSIKAVLRDAGRPDTAYGPLRLHKHGWTLENLRPRHHVFFCVRDPVARFVSGFHDRQRKAQPRYFFEWTEAEREAFETFATPQDLASALADDDAAAIRAMEGIRHVNAHQHHYLGRERELSARVHQILFIARTEHLSQEWPLLSAAIGLPEGLQLPVDPVAAHRNPLRPAPLDDRGQAAILAWYTEDVAVVRLCDAIRRERGFTAPGGEPRSLSWLRRAARGRLRTTALR